MIKYIKVYKNQVPEELCLELIDYIDTNPSIKSGINNGDVDNSVRDSESIFIPVKDCSKSLELYEKITDIMYKCLKKYASEIQSPLFNDCFELSHEMPSIMKYEKDKGFYNIHVDNFSFASSMRVISAVIYLNDVREGGETYFTEFDIKCKPEMGKILLFPSGFSYPHTALTPVSNTKYSMVWWFTYPGFDINKIFGRSG